MVVVVIIVVVVTVVVVVVVVVEVVVGISNLLIQRYLRVSLHEDQVHPKR